MRWRATARAAPSAGCRRRGCARARRGCRADVQGLDVALRELVLPLRGDGAEPAAVGLQREHDVVAHGQVVDDALVAAVLRRVRDAVRDGLARRAQPRGLAPDDELAACRRGRCRRAGARARCGRIRAGRRGRRPRPSSIGRSTGCTAPLRPSFVACTKVAASDSSTIDRAARAARGRRARRAPCRSSSARGRCAAAPRRGTPPRACRCAAR